MSAPLVTTPAPAYRRCMTTPRDFTALPEPVRLEDTSTSHDPGPVPDPQAGLNVAMKDALTDAG